MSDAPWPDCRFPGCGLKARTRLHRLCSAHYRQQQAGEELTPLRKDKRRNASACRIGGCDRPVQAKGLCLVHHRAWLNQETELPVDPEQVLAELEAGGLPPMPPMPRAPIPGVDCLPLARLAAMSPEARRLWAGRLFLWGRVVAGRDVRPALDEAAATIAQLRTELAEARQAVSV